MSVRQSATPAGRWAFPFQLARLRPRVSFFYSSVRESSLDHLLPFHTFFSPDPFLMSYRGNVSSLDGSNTLTLTW